MQILFSKIHDQLSKSIRPVVHDIHENGYLHLSYNQKKEGS